ncbi:MAG: hypothetical protein QF492_03585 [Candidatus Krumholzibacteria bacterium]|jgi:hypothetical protein|nr:hypothetical protein [Candidatus Krumholzibacteria bacterium]MDP6668980.1 hypothetical protein [Candidatus Krumholzibacteria bacterium]MDP6796854.1 hypothetical protein [Candidatus Krumholzibacteria bacterium]MDP7021364.1 hypothetical protein [Candidatus Krumholzibacteria bacterium]
MRSFLIFALMFVPALLWAIPLFEWSTTHDGGGSYMDNATVLLCDSEGHAIVGGESYDGNGGSDLLIRKCARNDGQELWQLRVPAYDDVSDMALSGMEWDSNGDLIVGGYVRGCGTG